MSVEVLSAPQGEPDKGAQEKILSRAESEAFDAIAKREDIDTEAIAADKKQQAIEAQQLKKVAELNTLLEDADDRRRGLKAIYKSDIIDSLSDSEIETLISDQLASKETLSPHQQEVPADAELYAIDDIENDAPTVGLRAKIMDKIGLVKGAGFGGNVLLVATQFAGRRENKQKKLKAKIDSMNPAEKEAYLRRNRAITTLSTLAIGTVYGLMRSRGMLFGDGPSHHAATADVLLTNNQESTTGSYELSSYNNSDSSFYDFMHKEHRGDFGTSLVADADHAKDTVNGKYNAGFADWMNRNKHEPNGLGNLRVGLGLEGNDTSFERRNQVADMFNADPALQQSSDKSLVEALNDPSKFTVESVSIDWPYTTTYMTDVNGDPVIGIQKHVDYGGEAFKFTNEQTKEVTFWRKNCGGYQQIWPEERPVVQEATSAGGATQYQEQAYTSSWSADQTTGTVAGNGNGSHGGGGGGGSGGGSGGEGGGSGGGGGNESNDDGKNYDGGTTTGDGINPAQNGFIEITTDPADTGNGTDSQSSDGQTAPGSEVNDQLGEGAVQNTDQQVRQEEAGAGDNRTAEDAAEQQRQTAAQEAQDAANKAAEQADKAAQQADAVDKAVKAEQTGIGADGRPKN